MSPVVKNIYISVAPSTVSIRVKNTPVIVTVVVNDA